MKILQPQSQIVYPSSQIEAIDSLKRIEKIGRVAYRSEDKITDDSYAGFIQRILNRGHESVIEHSSMTVYFICDRAIAQELTRHRLCAFTGESTRYCDYNDEIEFVQPFTENEHNNFDDWSVSILKAEEIYKSLRRSGVKPQTARSVLPLALAQRIYCTANYREWRHIFKLRTSPASHPQIREIMIPLLEEVKKLIPIVFDDIGA